MIPSQQEWNVHSIPAGMKLNHSIRNGMGVSLNSPPSQHLLNIRQLEEGIRHHEEEANRRQQEEENKLDYLKSFSSLIIGICRHPRAQTLI